MEKLNVNEAYRKLKGSVYYDNSLSFVRTKIAEYEDAFLEIKLDGKNMQKIYKGKSKLRILLDCRCDLTGYEKVKLAARKPDDTLVTFPAVVKDAENGIIFYDTQSESDIDQVGWWTFWPEFVFDDDRTSCGSAYRTFVYEVGT